MHRALAILFSVFCLQASGVAQVIPTQEVDGMMNSSSYGTPNYVLWERYLASHFHGMYPQWTNHIQDWSQSGSAWEFDYEDNLQKWCLPRMANFAAPFFMLQLANDNGSYVSNDVVQWGTNMAAAPPLFWNGTAVTNEGVSCEPATWYFAGGILADSSDQTAPTKRNDGCLYLNGLYATSTFDLFNELANGGWLADQAGSRLLGFYSGAHPFPAGHLCMAIWTLRNMNVETNVGTLTLDWGGAAFYTNHCIASGLSVNGNILTTTVHFDRMPMGWDVPDGTITNDARNAFVVMPALGNAFNWILQVTNLPVGTYRVAIDGSNVVQLTDAQLAAGWNMFTNYNGSLWAQRVAVQNSICDEYGVDHVTLIEAHDAGSGGIHGVNDLLNWKSQANNFHDSLGHHGSQLVSDMAANVGAMNTNATFTHNAAQQTNHTFTITEIIPRFIPAKRAQIPAELDETDLTGLKPEQFVPVFPQTTTEMLRLAVRAVTQPVAAPPQWIFPAAPVAPAKTFHLNWPASTDPTAVSYALQSTPDLAQRFYTVTNLTATNTVVVGKLWHEFYRVIAVNNDGLNSVGAYEW